MKKSEQWQTLLAHTFRGRWILLFVEQAEQRLREAKEILAQLRLFKRWQVFGTPVLVGAVAYQLEAWLELHPRNVLTFWKPGETRRDQVSLEI